MENTKTLWFLFKSFFHEFLIPFPYGGLLYHERKFENHQNHQNHDANNDNDHDNEYEQCPHEIYHFNKCQKYYITKTLEYSNLLRSLYENKYNLLTDAIQLLNFLKEESIREQYFSWFELNQRDLK